MTLYHRSPGYLKPEGKFLEIEAGPMAIFGLTSWWPVILGGTPRAFENVFSAPSGASAREAASWVEKGWIKEVPVDSTFEMDQALQVSLLKLVSVAIANSVSEGLREVSHEQSSRESICESELSSRSFFGRSRGKLNGVLLKLQYAIRRQLLILITYRFKRAMYVFRPHSVAVLVSNPMTPIKPFLCCLPPYVP